MKLRIEKPVTVITPTIGQPSLSKAIDSVNKQTYKNIEHLVVVDGPEYFAKIQSTIISFTDSKQKFTCTPNNTGAGGWYGHRIYAAYPHLINSDYILFLDEDNWYEPNHVETLIETIEKNKLDWAHSLRNVYIEDQFLAEDNCEAIGRWPIWFTQHLPKNQQQFLADTSTYAFKTDWLVKYSHNIHFGWGGDRVFLNSVMNESTYETTGLHTLNYKLPDMNKAYGGDIDFFHKGNIEVKKHYGGEYPWKKKE